jgi:starch synthase
LRDQGSRFTAIENGIDDDAYDPATDPQLPARFSVQSAPMARRSNKELLVRELGMNVEETTPLFAVVSRFAWQKGIDLLLPHVHELVTHGAAFVFVGTGDTALECAARDAERAHPGRVVARIGFDDRLARRIYGGADFVVVPSRFEPCGLTQLYAMRYGAIPVVTPVGGLRDTVTDVRIATPEGTPLGTGFVAKAATPHAVRDACRAALDFYREPDQMAALVRRAMARDSSWSRAAQAYERIYAECTEGWYGP